MDIPAAIPLHIGDWRVDPVSGRMSRKGEVVRLEQRALRLLLCLAEQAGHTVSTDELLERVWPGVIVTSDSVYQAVAGLRRLLGDDSRQSRYIATVPRMGYRMIAEVQPCLDGDAIGGETAVVRQDAGGNAAVAPAAVPASIAPPRRLGVLWMAASLAAVALVAAFLFQAKVGDGRASVPAASAPAPKSVAVLPFLDLTEGMKEEVFADGMTEELVDKFSKIPGLRVPSPTSSFYYKDKQLPVAEIAHALNVVYVVDGSVRKQDDRVRIAARLVRAADGFVIWSETYDKPVDDLLMVQDDIAGEVAKSLKTTISADAPPAQ